ETRKILEGALHPMLEKRIDTVVLGCTHYPFVIPLIEKIVGENVRVIDPAPAVAKQVKRLLEAGEALNQKEQLGSTRFMTSGDVEVVKSSLKILLQLEREVEAVTWLNDREIAA
ncbi:MAG TPA: aspartate/glutamate racemase family protein, partial [Anaerolineales bacterium]|nr:aspartate/glutamate racemase family protein [Anaerolineales bacterium]